MYPVTPSCQIANLSEMYVKHFGYRSFGRFVEIGAYDGKGFSNTWGLAEIGWKGLYVEPIHEIAEICRETHKHNKVTVAECAISDIEGEIKIWTNPELYYATSTIDEETMKISPFVGEYDPTRFRMVKTTTMDTLLKSYRIKPEFDLLVIDVEGAELRVLRVYDWKHWHPKMIIVEDHDGNQYPQKSIHTKAIAEWFAQTDYERVWHDTTNSIYVRP